MKPRRTPRPRHPAGSRFGFFAWGAAGAGTLALLVLVFAGSEPARPDPIVKTPAPRPVAAPISAPQRIPPVVVAPRPEDAKLFRKIRELLEEADSFLEHEAVLKLFKESRESIVRFAPARREELRRLEKDYRSRYEKAAEGFYTDIRDAGRGLAQEKRFDEALAVIETFPKHFRASRAWRDLDGLRRHIEHLRRAAFPNAARGRGQESPAGPGRGTWIPPVDWRDSVPRTESRIG